MSTVNIDTIFFSGNIPPVFAQAVNDTKWLEFAPAILHEVVHPNVVLDVSSNHHIEHNGPPGGSYSRGVAVKGLSSSSVTIFMHHSEGMECIPITVQIYLLSPFAPFKDPQDLTTQHSSPLSSRPATLAMPPSPLVTSSTPVLLPRTVITAYLWTTTSNPPASRPWMLSPGDGNVLSRMQHQLAGDDTKNPQDFVDDDDTWSKIEWNPEDEQRIGTEDEGEEIEKEESSLTSDRENSFVFWLFRSLSQALSPPLVLQTATSFRQSPERQIPNSSSFAKGRLPIISVEECAVLIQKITVSNTSPLSEVRLPRFGHEMKPLFEVDQRYLNINCGSYGVTPLPVTLAATAFSSHIERNPDWFIRQELESLLLTIRQKLAPLVGCKDVDELVLVPGASHGLGTVFWNLAVAMELGDGDVIVEFSTTYGSIRSTLQFLRDTRPGLIISTLELAFPLSRAALLRKFQAHIRSILSSSYHGRRRPRKVIAIIDTVSSNPGIRFPWEDMVRICRDLGVFSFVDGAHGAGLVPVDLDSADPDTFVSNCHKWMSSKRASAFLYVPKRNHHLMLSTFPVSHNYTTPTPKDPPTRFGSMHNSTGTHDWVPILSIAWGINFRDAVGGEGRIQEYCRTLALEGGRVMARVWHTQVMDDMQLENGDTWAEEGELTTAMVNVLLPLPIPSSHSQSDDQLQRVLQYLQDAMFTGGFYIPVFLHGPRYIQNSHNKDGRRWWVRASAQIWLELSDFETVAYKMLDICTEVKNNPELFPPH